MNIVHLIVVKNSFYILESGRTIQNSAHSVLFFWDQNLAKHRDQTAWSTCVRLVWDVPRTTHTYLVENVLADNFVPLRIQIYGRYASFFRQLFVSASKEVRHLARIASRDCRSVTWRNVQLITAVCGYSPWDYSANKIKKHIPLVKVPTEDWWRPGFLRKLLECRFYKRTKQVDDMIESLCSS